MASVLDEILASKRVEVERARTARPVPHLQALPGYSQPRRDFYAAVATPRQGRPNLIAEIKRASPSAGLIRPDFDPVAIAQLYARADAQALSILTDEKYFDGRLEFIARVKAAVKLPVLRKDFIVDPYQVYESRAFGADAILLIAEALELPLLLTLLDLAGQLGLAVLLEFHTHAPLLAALSAIPPASRKHLLIGINNRDLRTQKVDLATAEQLIPLVPPELPIVAESGMKTRQDVARMHAAGARALLIGETLMRSPDPQATIQQLFG